MLFFSTQTAQNYALPEREHQILIINPYSQNLVDFDEDLKKLKEESASQRSLGYNSKTSQMYKNYQIILEIEKIKYRIDYQKRLLKLHDIFTKTKFVFSLKLVLNGEQAIQDEEISILKKILSLNTSFSQVEIRINQVDNQFDWNLLELLTSKQIGTLILRVDKYCTQSLRSLTPILNKIRIISKAKLILKEDIPLKVFDLFAWPAKIQLEVEEVIQPSSTLKLQFLSDLKFISQLDIKYIDNTSYSASKILLPILASQLKEVQKLDRITFFFEERFSSSLHQCAIKKATNAFSFLDQSLFLPYERYLPTIIKSEKFNAEKNFYQALSGRNLLEISLTITVNQIIQLFQMFQRQTSFIKLSIRVISNKFNLYPQFHSTERDDDIILINTLNKLQLDSVSIKNLILTSEKSLSYENRKTLYNRFAIMCINLLGCKISKLNLNIQAIKEGDLEKLAKKINMNPQLKHLNIFLQSKVTFTNNTIIYLANSHIQSMSCVVTQKSYQFFYELFLNIKSLQALHIKIEQIPQLSDKFFTLNIPYIYLQLNQQVNYKQKMIIFGNKNIFLYFNSSETQKRTIFTHLYLNNLSYILSLNAIYKKCAYTSVKQVFQTSLLELLSL